MSSDGKADRSESEPTPMFKTASDASPLSSSCFLSATVFAS